MSKSPVGSSNNKILGELAKERAIATRYYSPPDNSEGRWSNLSCNPTLVNNSIVLFLHYLLFNFPNIFIGNSTFSNAVIVAIRLNV